MKNLFVNRYANEESYMKTEEFVKFLEKNKLYKFYKNNIDTSIDTSTDIDIDIDIPILNENKYLILEGSWINTKESLDPSNILGGIGLFKTEMTNIKIPIIDGTKDNYMYYGCQMYKEGETFSTNIDIDMPMFKMKITKNYGKDYIFSEKYANGMYIEYHNTPHIYINLNNKDDNDDGYLVLGKKISENKYNLSAIKIPKKYMIFIPPYVIHNDCFLIGQYYVVYNLANDFSTVRIINNDNKFINIEFNQI